MKHDGKIDAPDKVDASASILREHAMERLCRDGLESDSAEAIVDQMIFADLLGKHSHGIGVRLPGILDLLAKGLGKETPSISSDRGNHVLVNGNDAFGQVSGRFCAGLLRQRTSKHGLAVVALKNTRHTGMLGYYVDMICRFGAVTMAFSHCRPLVAPFGASESLLGTNPVAFGFPNDPEPIIMDMATSEINYGKVLECISSGTSLKDGCAIGPDGKPTVDPVAARDGALMPFGGHRGNALSIAIQILAGVFTGASSVPRDGTDYGLLLIGMRKDLFSPEKEYAESIRQFVEAYTGCKSAEEDELRLPGAGWEARTCRDQSTVMLSIPGSLAVELDIS